LEIAVTSLNIGTSVSQSVEIAYLVSPVIWSVTAQGSEDYVVTNSFSLSGGEHLVRAGTVAYCGAAVGALANSLVTGTVEEICVEVLD
jgi:hypothetical protein